MKKNFRILRIKIEVIVATKLLQKTILMLVK